MYLVLVGFEVMVISLINHYFNDKYYLLFFSNSVFFFQAQELRRYFKGLGAEISEEKSSKGIEDDLHKIIGVCDVCFKDGDPTDIDAILNSIVSIMVSVSEKKCFFDFSECDCNNFLFINRFHWIVVRILYLHFVKS